MAAGVIQPQDQLKEGSSKMQLEDTVVEEADSMDMPWDSGVKETDPSESQSIKTFLIYQLF